MNAKIPVAVLLLMLVVPALRSAAVDDFLSGMERERVYDVKAFREFFAGTKPLTAFQVRDRFGMPHKLGPLNREDAGKKLSPYRAWWYYELGPTDSVGVMVEDGKVIGVIRHHGRQTEVMREPPRPAEKKAEAKR